MAEERLRATGSSTAGTSAWCTWSPRSADTLHNSLGWCSVVQCGAVHRCSLVHCPGAPVLPVPVQLPCRCRCRATCPPPPSWPGSVAARRLVREEQEAAAPEQKWWWFFAGELSWCLDVGGSKPGRVSMAWLPGILVFVGVLLVEGVMMFSLTKPSSSVCHYSSFNVHHPSSSSAHSSRRSACPVNRQLVASQCHHFPYKAPHSYLSSNQSYLCCLVSLSS